SRGVDRRSSSRFIRIGSGTDNILALDSCRKGRGAFLIRPPEYGSSSQVSCSGPTGPAVPETWVPGADSPRLHTSTVSAPDRRHVLPALSAAAAVIECLPFDSVGVNCQEPDASVVTTPSTTPPSTMVTRLFGVA